MASIVCYMDQGMTLIGMPTQTTIVGEIQVGARAYQEDISMPMTRITLPVTANRVAWRGAIITAIEEWALTNGHTVIGILWPDLDMI